MHIGILSCPSNIGGTWISTNDCFPMLSGPSPQQRMPERQLQKLLNKASSRLVTQQWSAIFLQGHWLCLTYIFDCTSAACPTRHPPRSIDTQIAMLYFYVSIYDEAPVHRPLNTAHLEYFCRLEQQQAFPQRKLKRKGPAVLALQVMRRQGQGKLLTLRRRPLPLADLRRANKEGEPLRRSKQALAADYGRPIM